MDAPQNDGGYSEFYSGSDLSGIRFTPSVIALLLVVGLFHTGFAYALYFGSMDALPAHTLALIGYLDPVLAILLSTLVLREPMTAAQGFGAALILCAALVAELPEKQTNKEESPT